MFAANHLRHQLETIGHDAVIVKEWDESDPDLHILYQVSNKYGLPKNYILQQTEPWNSHWFNDNYRDTIKNALAVWDYSEDNQKCYEHPKKAIVTPGINPQSVHIKDVEHLFYGHVDGSLRRGKKLDELRAELNLTVVTNITGPAMWKILQHTKTVYNIHYHKDSPLELYRFHEALSFGCKVWLCDEQRFYTHTEDNLEEIKRGLALVGI